jgi:hypothetical protein
VLEDLTDGALPTGGGVNLSAFETGQIALVYARKFC